MGSGSSKDSSSPAATGSSGPRGLRSRVFSSSCFGVPSTLLPHDLDDEGEEKGGSVCSENDGSRKMPHLSLCDVEEDHSSSQIEFAGGASSSSSSIPKSRSRSRFGFIPDRIGLRLSRTVSLGSTSIPNNERDEIGTHNVDNSNESGENVVAVVADSLQHIDRDNVNIGSVARNDETRRSNRRVAAQESLEGNVRFSRTLSVGRLRHRVLRRSSSNAGIFGGALLEDRPGIDYDGQDSERRAFGSRGRIPSPSGTEVWPDFPSSHPYSYDLENGTLQLREANNHNLLEHRPAFLERRRRIRSQVRALQRLGSRFENLSGHERSCILSGQHRTGRCTCRTSNRVANPNDDTGTRASISRIVMLAEALFEVLDEIHQQSVALSSRPSFSSIGSVPAPKEVVECMPVKVYVKPQKPQDEEAAQCYICLVEYEDGDFMRMLPCNHEFHQTCIDKWLKEIHRVCPLCRGDVCRSGALSSDKIS